LQLSTQDYESAFAILKIVFNHILQLWIYLHSGKYFMHHTQHDKEKSIAIRRTLEYIQMNIGEDLSLEKLSSVANYSPFHFQRLFLAFVGETPKQYIIRLRLERIAHFLKVFPSLSISELAADSGFASPATFARAFKNYFGIPAEEFRSLPHSKVRKNCKTNRKNCKANLPEHSEFWGRDFSESEIMEWKDKVEITTKQFAGMHVAYVSTCLDNPDAITHAFRELTNWALPRFLINADTKFIGMLLDIPFITPLDKCRYRAGITLNTKPALKKDVSTTEIPQGTFASYRVKGNTMAIVKSLIYFKHCWLDPSGYQIKDISGFEIFDVNPADKPSEQIAREIIIPVIPS
jgi:AraC family transcriptional regulator